MAPKRVGGRPLQIRIQGGDCLIARAFHPLQLTEHLFKQVHMRGKKIIIRLGLQPGPSV